MEPAPGELKIVQAFVNTAVRRKRAEELTSPEALARWLARWRLLAEEAELTAADLELAIALREGMRALLRANNGAAVDEKAVAMLERAAAKVPLRLRVDAEGAAYLAPASNHAKTLGRLLGIFAAARFGTSWPRFKACADGGCGSAFYDLTRNLGSKWCSSRCGNRSGARAWRCRQRSS